MCSDLIFIPFFFIFFIHLHLYFYIFTPLCLLPRLSLVMKNDSMIQLALSRDHFHSSGAIHSPA